MFQKWRQWGYSANQSERPAKNQRIHWWCERETFLQPLHLVVAPLERERPQKGRLKATQGCTGVGRPFIEDGEMEWRATGWTGNTRTLPRMWAAGHTPKAGDSLKKLASVRGRWRDADIWKSPKERLGAPITLGPQINPPQLSNNLVDSKDGRDQKKACNMRERPQSNRKKKKKMTPERNR